MHPQGSRIFVLAGLAGLLFAGLLWQSPALAADAESAGKSRLVDLWRPGDPGERMNIRGRVTGPDGTPLPGIEISIRQADGEGDYTAQYRAVIVSDEQGRYQFGSVVPGNYTGARHVHVTVYQPGWEYFDTSILFEGDPNLDAHYEEGTPIFLEESTVNGETILFGRFDIVLSPE